MSNPLGNDGIGVIVEGNHRIAMTVDQYNEALARSAKVEREDAVETERDRIAAYAKSRLCWKRDEGKECMHDACFELLDLIEKVWKP
jgi:hypothetical protein